MYAEVKDLIVVTWPYDFDTLQKHNPYTKFPTDVNFVSLYEGTKANLEGKTLVSVSAEPAPTYDAKTQKLVQNDKPSFVNGSWIIGWTVSALTAEEQNKRFEQTSSEIRTQRNRYLSNSDWTQLSDSTVNKTVWATYRQALRDVPQQIGFPFNVNWPNKPE